MAIASVFEMYGHAAATVLSFAISWCIITYGPGQLHASRKSVELCTTVKIDRKSHHAKDQRRAYDTPPPLRTDEYSKMMNVALQMMNLGFNMMTPSSSGI